jgi:hypothetical protein
LQSFFTEFYLSAAKIIKLRKKFALEKTTKTKTQGGITKKNNAVGSGVAEPHHFYAAIDENLDAVPAPNLLLQ